MFKRGDTVQFNEANQHLIPTYGEEGVYTVLKVTEGPLLPMLAFYSKRLNRTVFLMTTRFNSAEGPW